MNYLSQFLEQHALESHTKKTELPAFSPEKTEEVPAGPMAGYAPLDLEGHLSVGDDSQALQVLHMEEALARDTETLEDATLTLEAYVGLLRRSGPQGVTQREMESIRIGLSPYSRLFTGTLTPSVECFVTERSAAFASQVSLETFMQVLSELWKTLKEGFYRMLDKGAEFYRQFQQGVGRMQTRALALKQPISRLNGQPTQVSFRLDNPSKVMAEGKYYGDDPAVIAGAAGWFCRHYPQELATYIKSLARAVDLITPQNLREISDNLLQLEGPQHKFREANKDVMPGNLTIVTTTVEGITEDKLKHLSHLLSAERFILQPVSGTNPETYEVTVRTPQELARGLTELLRTLELIDSMRDKAPALAEVSKQLLTAADKLRQRFEKVALIGEDQALLQAIMRGIFAVTRMSGPDLHPLIMYFVSVVQAQLAILEREIHAYKPA